MESTPTPASTPTPRRRHVALGCTLASLITLGMIVWVADLRPRARTPVAGAPSFAATTATAPTTPAAEAVTVERAASSLQAVRRDLHKVALSADDLIKLLEALELEPAHKTPATAARGQ